MALTQHRGVSRLGARLVPNHALLLVACAICGWTFDAEAVAVEVVVDGEATGRYLCPSCLHGGAEGLRATLIERAEAFEQRAACLRQVASGRIEVPTHHEYVAALRAVEGEQQQDTWAEGAA